MVKMQKLKFLKTPGIYWKFGIFGVELLIVGCSLLLLWFWGMSPAAKGLLAINGLILIVVFIQFVLFARAHFRQNTKIRQLLQKWTSDHPDNAELNRKAENLGSLPAAIDQIMELLVGQLEETTQQLEISAEALQQESELRRQAQEALNKSKLLFSELWDISVDGMRLTDAQGVILAVNNAFCKTVGLSKTDLEGKLLTVIYHPSERHEIYEIYINGVCGNSLKSHFEKERLLWNGQMVWFEISNTLLESPDGDKTVLSVINDITSRKKAELELLKSEKKFRLLFNNANDAVMVNRLTEEHKIGAFLEVNDVACFRLGYSREEFLRLDPFDTIPARYYDTLDEAAATLVRNNRAMYELTHIRKDKRRIPVEINSHLFEFDNQPAILSIARDITERKRVEKQLNDTSEQLRNLASRLQVIREEERTMIAREIHDELGQALTVLKIQLSLLPKKLHDGQPVIREKIDLALELIDGLVETVQKISAQLRPGILDELGLVPAIEWQSQDFQRRTGIACESLLTEEDLNLSKEKSTAVFRIFQEALTNVARHAEAKKVSVNLRKEDNMLILEITDNGVGISKGQIDHANSLGLLGMKERALVFGGKVAIYGVPGQGTHVQMELPLV